MKTKYALLQTLFVALICTCNSWSQTIITQWNFNGTTATTVPGGASSPTAAIGSGSAALVGAVTATFASGISSGGSTDPVITVPDNYGWNTTNYAQLGAENKQRGVQFNVSTVGYQGIIFRFDQRLSNSSNNTYVVQYTTDHTALTPVWVDAVGGLFTFPPGVTAVSGGDMWYNLRSVDLSAVTALDNNANAAFRVVSAFDPATGNYNSSTMAPIVYLTTGTSRFDMVTVSANIVLGVSQFETAKNSFKVYPNPSNREIVHFNQAQDVKVFDALGKLVLNAKNTTAIDTKTFSAGVYFIKTTTGITKKLIVK